MKEPRWHVHEHRPGEVYAVSPDHRQKIGPMTRTEAEIEAAYQEQNRQIALEMAAGRRRWAG